MLGVDLEPIKPVRGVKTFVADITGDKCRSLIRKEANGKHFDVVLHDGAPNVGGAWHSEALTQARIVVVTILCIYWLIYLIARCSPTCIFSP